MNKQQFLDLGLTDEQATKAEAESKKELESYIPKTRFDEVNEAKKQLDKDIKARDTQIEDIKKNAGDNEELKKQIETLQTENKTTKEKYEADLKDLQISNAIKLAIADKAQDADLVSGLFDKSKLILGDDGKITGLDEQLKSLQESKAFLFKTGKTETNYNPAGGKQNKGSNPFAKETFNLTEQGKLLKENPAQAKELANSAGVTLNI